MSTKATKGAKAKPATATRPKVSRTARAAKTKSRKKMAIIFLDIDGVMNCMPDNRHEVWPDFRGGSDERAYGLNPQLVANLKELIDRTDAKIVVSSSWRHFEDYEPFDFRVKWRDVLAERVGKKTEDLFIGQTPILSTVEMLLHGISEYTLRGHEIKAWMDNNRKKFGRRGVDYSFCIIDDEVTDILSVFDPRYVVHTSYKKGFTKEDVERAYHILKFAD